MGHMLVYNPKVKGLDLSDWRWIMDILNWKSILWFGGEYPHVCFFKDGPLHVHIYLYMHVHRHIQAQCAYIYIYTHLYLNINVYN